MNVIDPKRRNACLAATLILVAAAMRAPIGCVGPLIDSIREDLSLSASAAGMLTTIPLIFFAVSAPLASRISQTVDNRLNLCLCLAAGACGVLVRSFGGTAGLFAGTALLGISIGILNVFLPALVRHQNLRVGLAMGIYTASMTAASAFSSGISQQLAAALNGWRAGMAVFFLVSAAALILCLGSRALIEPRFPAAEHTAPPARVFTAGNVVLAFFSGLQALIFFSLITWYPSIVRNVAPDFTNAGMLVLLMQLISLVPALAVPVLAGGFRRPGALACVSALLPAAGFLLLYANSSKAAVIAATALIGTGLGASLSLALTLIALTGRTATETARSSAFIQFFSYTLASIGPAGVGLVYDFAGNWGAMLLIFALISAVMAAIGLLIRRPAGRPEKDCARQAPPPK